MTMKNAKVLAAHFLPLYDTDLDPLSVVSKAFCGLFVRDRFGVLNKYSPYRVSEQVDEIPTPFDSPVPFSDLMDKTAVALIERANGGDVVVCWSGGIDSTGVVVSLLKHLADKSRLKIICAPSALEEYPLFYNEFLVKQGISVTVTNAVVKTLDTLNCGVITSGWCSDQLFGSDTHLRIPDAYNLPWIDGVAELYAFRTSGRVKLSAASLELLEAVYQDYASRLGVVLNQYCEFAWLFNFGCKFTFVKEVMRLKMPESKNRDKCVPFYSGFDFQRWSVGNFENIKANNGYIDPEYLKPPIKQYIVEYTNDVDYRRKKGKRNSYGMVGESPADFVSVLTDEGFKVARLSGDCDGCAAKLSRAVGEQLRRGA